MTRSFWSSEKSHIFYLFDLSHLLSGGSLGNGDISRPPGSDKSSLSCNVENWVLENNLLIHTAILRQLAGMICLRLGYDGSILRAPGDKSRSPGHVLFSWVFFFYSAWKISSSWDEMKYNQWKWVKQIFNHFGLVTHMRTLVPAAGRM